MLRVHHYNPHLVIKKKASSNGIYAPRRAIKVNNESLLDTLNWVKLSVAKFAEAKMPRLGQSCHSLKIFSWTMFERTLGRLSYPS